MKKDHSNDLDIIEFSDPNFPYPNVT